MSRYDLTDAQRQVLEPLLLSMKKGCGRPRSDNRKWPNGILYFMKTGVARAESAYRIRIAFKYSGV
jgi:transposase